jgi:hypothetical protein
MNRRSFLRQAAAAIAAIAVPVKLAATATARTPAIPGHLVGNEVVATIGPGGDYATFAAWDSAWDNYCGKNLMAAKVSATAVILPGARNERKYIWYWTAGPEHHVTIKADGYGRDVGETLLRL